MPTVRDDLGRAVQIEATDRIVSLVPSLTETVALERPDVLVGCTDWCTHPSDLAARRIGGTKNPDVAAILALRPDVVLANDEENRAPDLQALRDGGVRVYVTAPTTVDQACDSLTAMLEAIDIAPSGWIDTARQSLSHPVPSLVGLRYACAIWRRPWMVLGRDTFAADMLRSLGMVNVFADHPDRYPKVSLDEVAAHNPDLVVLPDEPYAFSATDGPEAFVRRPSALVSGRHLTWYGPSMVEARSVLSAALTRPVRRL